MNEQQLTKNERRKLKHEQRKEEKIKQQKEFENKNKIKKFATIAIVVIFLGSIFSFFTFFAPQPTGNVTLNTGSLSFPLGKIHWHATPNIEICGEKKQISTPASDVHLGTSLLHTHKDALIHIEGFVSDPSQMTLGGFFDNIGTKFSEAQIMDKKNGDSCQNNSAGTLKMSVNGLSNNEFRNYVIRDGDTIKIKFE